MDTLIENLCEEYTNLTEKEIEIIKIKAKEVSKLAEESQQEVFIDCPCRNTSEAVVVAEALKENTLYHISTLGCIVREEDEPGVFRSFRTGEITEEVEARVFSSKIDGIVIQNISPILYEERTIGVVIYEKPAKMSVNKGNSEKIAPSQVLPALKDTVALMEYFEDAAIVVNKKGIVMFRNQAARNLYIKQGYRKDILGKEYNKVSLYGTTKKFSKTFSKWEMKIGGFYYRIQQIYLERQEMYLITLRDITELKMKEEKLIVNSVYIREIHHRIKNNLQNVLSLLQLQTGRMKSEEARAALTDAQNRIQSIAVIQDVLLNHDQDKVSLFEVFNKLKIHFYTLTSINRKEIEIVIEGKDREVDSDFASTISLVVNELIQNAVKYAFEGRKKGCIWIEISEENMGYVMITVQDNGIGYHSEKVQEGLGLNIVRSLVYSKLKGRLEVLSDSSGTITQFDFKIKQTIE